MFLICFGDFLRGPQGAASLLLPSAGHAVLQGKMGATSSLCDQSITPYVPGHWLGVRAPGFLRVPKVPGIPRGGSSLTLALQKAYHIMAGRGRTIGSFNTRTYRTY